MFKKKTKDIKTPSGYKIRVEDKTVRSKEAIDYRNLYREALELGVEGIVDRPGAANGWQLNEDWMEK